MCSSSHFIGVSPFFTRLSLPWAGRFRVPGRGAFLVHPCQGRFRAPARGPFGAAQKGRKGRLGAAAPKDPIDVQWGNPFSFRRVGIVLPLRPLPGLRPCLGRHPNRFSPDTAPGAVGEGRWFLSCKFTPHHKQQEKPRNYYFPILGARRFTGRQAQFGKCQGA